MNTHDPDSTISNRWPILFHWNLFPPNRLLRIKSRHHIISKHFQSSSPYSNILCILFRCNHNADTVTHLFHLVFPVANSQLLMWGTGKAGRLVSDIFFRLQKKGHPFIVFSLAFILQCSSNIFSLILTIVLSSTLKFLMVINEVLNILSCVNSTSGYSNSCSGKVILDRKIPANKWMMNDRIWISPFYIPCWNNRTRQ